MTLGSPPQSPSGYYSPPLHSLSLASPTHQQHHPYHQQQQQGLYQQQPQQQQLTPQTGQSGYLPGFLMGDPMMPSPSTPSASGRNDQNDGLRRTKVKSTRIHNNFYCSNSIKQVA